MGNKLVFLAVAGTGLLILAGSVAGAAPGSLDYTQAPADFEQLVKAAKAEGTIVVSGIDSYWVNYDEIFDTFSHRYGITVIRQNSTAAAHGQMEAIRDHKAGKGMAGLAPDVVEVGMADAQTLKNSGLAAPYKVKTWNSIPGSFKDPDGYWAGGYYGNLVFEVNPKLIKDPPKDWKDLLKPEFKGKFALFGNPGRGYPPLLVKP